MRQDGSAAAAGELSNFELHQLHQHRMPRSGSLEGSTWNVMTSSQKSIPASSDVDVLSKSQRQASKSRTQYNCQAPEKTNTSYCIGLSLQRAHGNCCTNVYTTLPIELRIHSPGGFPKPTQLRRTGVTSSLIMQEHGHPCSFAGVHIWLDLCVLPSLCSCATGLEQSYLKVSSGCSASSALLCRTRSAACGFMFQQHRRRLATSGPRTSPILSYS